MLLADSWRERGRRGLRRLDRRLTSAIASTGRAAVFAAALILVGAASSVVSADPPAGSTLTRAEEPVVIQQSLPDQTGYATGSINVELPDRLLGIAPGTLVAFRWD